MKPKRIIQLLKKTVREKIPSETYLYIAKYDRPSQDENGQWKVGEIAQGITNNERKIKKIYKQYGLAACQAWFYVKLKSKEENEQKESGPDFIPQEGTGAVSERVD